MTPPAAPLRVECRGPIAAGQVALDYAALPHNLQYLGIRRNLRSIDISTEGRRNWSGCLTNDFISTPWKNINQFLPIAGIDGEDVDQRNWLSIPGHGANQI